MNVVIFNKANIRNVTNGEKFIRVSAATGIISFSKAAGKELGWAKEDKVIFAQDPDNNQIWYIAKADAKDKEAFTLKFTNDILAIGSKGMVQNILSGFGEEVKSKRFDLSTTGTESSGYTFYQLTPVEDKPKATPEKKQDKTSAKDEKKEDKKDDKKPAAKTPGKNAGKAGNKANQADKK